MTKLHASLEELFNRLSVQIHDSAGKEVSHMAQVIELILTGRMTNWNETAHYDHAEDKIYVPEDYEDYNRVAAHELIHWTGHKTRTGRYKGYLKAICCPIHAYNLEEIVAELGSLMLCAKLGITPKDNRRRFIAGWRSTFIGSQTHTKREAYAIAQRDAAIAIEYILQKERKAA